jgi:hypothetical protein
MLFVEVEPLEIARQGFLRDFGQFIATRISGFLNAVVLPGSIESIACCS